MREDGYEPVTRSDDLAEARPRAARLSSGDQVCLVRAGGRVYAIDDRCSHAGYSLSDGDMVDDHVIECSLHGAQFDVRDGSVHQEPADQPVDVYDVKEEDGSVWVRRRRRVAP
jgi:3-phenylpropionate/trans-cinnamate dioxygenase ferredoxin subunit